MARVRVSVPIRPTEDPEKVRRAVVNLFPDLQIEATADGLRGETSSLDHLREMIRNQKIRDTARGVLLRMRTAGSTHIELSKQAAYMGRVSFGASSPLGDIEVAIDSEDLEGTIDFLAESTVGPITTSSRIDRT